MGIELSVVAGLCYASSSVNAGGVDRHTASVDEVEIFGLGSSGTAGREMAFRLERI